MSGHPIGQNDLLSRAYHFTAGRLLEFELKSWIGRRFLNRKPRVMNSPALLHLGSGTNKFENWVNADFFCGFRPWAPVLKPDWMVDLRYPLNCDSRLWDGIFTEHTLEHLTPPDALNLLRECRRVLKPGAWIRVVVPDLEKYVEFYLHPDQVKYRNPNFQQWKSGAEALYSLAHHFQHLSLWDGSLLHQQLAMAGFRKVTVVGFKQGADPRLLRDDPSRAWESLYCEGQADS